MISRVFMLMAQPSRSSSFTRMVSCRTRSSTSRIGAKMNQLSRLHWQDTMDLRSKPVMIPRTELLLSSATSEISTKRSMKLEQISWPYVTIMVAQPPKLLGTNSSPNILRSTCTKSTPWTQTTSRTSMQMVPQNHFLSSTAKERWLIRSNTCSHGSLMSQMLRLRWKKPRMVACLHKVTPCSLTPPTPKYMS